MTTIPLQLRVKFAEAVWHDQPYMHPQLRQQVEKDFYGRKAPRELAEQILWAFMGKPIVFLGERRAGKTSMLKLLMHSLQSDPRFIPVEVPWLGIRSADDLMRELLDNLYFKLDLDNAVLRDAFLQIRTTAEFHRTIASILKYAPNNKYIVFGIDEFDSIIIEQADETKKHEIIGVISSMVEAQSLPVNLVLTMTRELSRIETGHSSPLTAKAVQIRLEPFAKADLDEMVFGILGQDSLNEQDQERIFNLSGGWPYFAKALLYYLVQFPPSEERLEQAKEKAIRDHSLSDALEHIYQKHWDDSHKTMILLVAQRGGQVTGEEMAVVEQSVKAAAKELVQRGYLLEAGNGYHFRIGLLQDWFLQWPRFEEQVHKYVKNILLLIERKNDPWAGVSDDQIIEITKNEIRRQGF